MVSSSRLLFAGAALLGFVSAAIDNKSVTDFNKLPNKCAQDCAGSSLEIPEIQNCDGEDTKAAKLNCICMGGFLAAFAKCMGQKGCQNTSDSFDKANAICWPNPTITSPPAGKAQKPTPTNLSEAQALLKSGHFDRATTTPTPQSTVFQGNSATAGPNINQTVVSGATVGGLLSLGLIGLCIFCCIHKRKTKKKEKGKRLEDDAESAHGADKYTGGSDKKTWYNGSQGVQRSLPDDDTKEIGQTTYAPVPYPQTSYDSSKTQVPTAPAPAKKAYAERISLTYAPQPQRPSLTLQSPVIVLPQATVDDYSPTGESKRNSLRHSQQSANFAQQQQQQQLQNGKLQPSNINIPLMFFTPATPQMNASPVSPARSSGGPDIFDRYAEMKTADSGVGIAQSTSYATTRDPSSNSPSPPPSYTFQPLNIQHKQQITTQYNNFPRPPAVIDASAVPRTVPSGAGIYITGNRNSNPHPSTATDPGPPPHDRAPTPPEPAYTPSAYPSAGNDLSAVPSTINKANSHQWRMSVERAADKAMERVRYSVGSRCDDVPEEEERLTRSGETDEDMSRGRSKYRRSGATGVSPNGRVSLQRPGSRRATTGSVSSIDTSRSRSRNGRSSISLTRAMDRTASRRASNNVMMV